MPMSLTSEEYHADEQSSNGAEQPQESAVLHEDDQSELRGFLEKQGIDYDKLFIGKSATIQ